MSITNIGSMIPIRSARFFQISTELFPRVAAWLFLCQPISRKKLKEDFCARAGPTKSFHSDHSDLRVCANSFSAVSGQENLTPQLIGRRDMTQAGNIPLRL